MADATLQALTRLRSYLRSSGRYGASPFLVGHYGGLGEVAQGFCRVSAVNGGVYILDRKTEEIVTPSSGSGDKFVVHLDDFPEPLTADVLVASNDQLPSSLRPPSAQDALLSPIARCIAIIDKAIPFPALLTSEEEVSGDGAPATPGEDGAGQSSQSTSKPETPAETPPVDTSLIIYPPGSVDGGSSTRAGQAFITGAGTLSAPQGKCKGFMYCAECSRLICCA